MQQLRKYTTVMEPLLGSGPRTKIEVLLEAVFSMDGSEQYHSTDRAELVQSRAEEQVGW
jgi:hypothetical protein